MTCGLWLDDAPALEYRVLESDQRIDALVAGGGITGMTGALQLASDDLSVCVVE